MTQKDTPWGAEEFIINTDVRVPDNHANVVMKKAMLDAEELTEVERHRNANVIVYVLKGAVDLKAGEDFFELEEGDSYFIESNTAHQLENLDDSVSEVLRVVVPYNRDDVEILENPYE